MIGGHERFRPVAASSSGSYRKVSPAKRLQSRPWRIPSHYLNMGYRGSLVNIRTRSKIGPHENGCPLSRTWPDPVGTTSASGWSPVGHGREPALKAATHCAGAGSQ